jgi:hypothetical protein
MKENKYISKQILLLNLGISRGCFEYRCKALDLTPKLRGHYTNEQFLKIKNFNKTKEIKVRKKIKNTIYLNRLEIIKVTETYHIYPSKINYEN